MMDARRLRVSAAVLFLATFPRAVHPQAPNSIEPVRNLLLQGRYVDAEAGARSLLAEVEAKNGPDSLEAAEVIDALVEALWRGGKVRAPETRSLAERSVAIKEAQLGPSHPGVGSALTTLGIVLRLRGDYPGARSLFERALSIQEQALGTAHPELARTLTMAALLAVDTGDLSAAQGLHERALSIREQALGAGDPGVAENLNGLGVILERRGDSAGAERYHERALAIREKALGPEHPDVAASLNNLANLRSDTGDYAAARSLHERALSIREKALGPEHPDVAMSLNNLAIAVRDLGDHAAAWWLLERVLRIWEKTFGPDHPNVAFACHNLAAVLLDLGDEAGSRLLAERARRFRAAPPESAALAESLNGLVGIDPPLEANAATRALLTRALAIKEKALGPSHTSVATTLTSLATASRELGRTEDVRALYERALAIREKAFGPEHPDVADTLDRLGEFLEEIGDYGGARLIYERVLAMTEKLLGPDHPHAGVVRQHLAEVMASAGDVAVAVRMALEAERVGREHLRLVGRSLPEREALMYAANRPVGLDVALTLLSRSEGGSAVSSAAVWDAVIRSRAVVLDEMASRNRTVVAAESSEVSRLAAELASKRERLARLLVLGPGASGEEYRAELAVAREERDQAERALAERSLEFREDLSQQRFGFEDMKAALPRESALIAFVRYSPHSPRKHVDAAGPKPTAAYLAFIGRALDPGEPDIVPLGSAEDLDSEIARWRRQMTAVALGGDSAAKRAEAAVRRSGLLLRAKLWDPVAAHLEGESRVFIVPDGTLHLVNWEALPASGSAYLIEEAPLLHYLSAERDLAASDRRAAGEGLLVIDSPAFDDRPQLAARAEASPSPAERIVFRGAKPDCGDLEWLRFDPLPASKREAETIAGIWRRSHGFAPGSSPVADAVPGLESGSAVERLSGAAATEAALKERAAGARVLHLATHGFFLGGRCASPLAQAADEPNRESAPGGSDAGNPLLLAGFALAGANQREAAGPDEEDGVLTAEEIAALDLRGLEWAVLSGCDTGVGEVRAGEGVFGLRRAFQVAGARTVIMSLWPVDDENTRRWMMSLYEERFARGAGTMGAVREASLGELRRLRKKGSSTHPFYWAAFIAAGDWR